MYLEGLIIRRVTVLGKEKHLEGHGIGRETAFGGRRYWINIVFGGTLY